MQHGRFFGLCTMLLAGILFLVQGYISYGPKSPGEIARVGPPTENSRAPVESKQRSNPTALILAGILLVLGGGMYYSEVRCIRPLWVKNQPENKKSA